LEERGEPNGMCPAADFEDVRRPVLPRGEGLQTVRLTVRRFEHSDVDPFLTYRNDPEVAKYQSWESCTKQEAIDLVQEMEATEPGTPGEWFQFAIELKQTGTLIGDCGMKTEADGRQAEIGFTFSRAYQGQGLASEAVARLLDYAFGELDLHRIYAITDQENAPSVALLERLGLRREGEFVENAWFKGRWSSEYLYAILRNEWLHRLRDDADKGPQGGTT
jgi:RimJ/RimL family protein N-acetyltransferase